MLSEAGLPRGQCFVTNVARSRPLGNDIDHFFRRVKKRPDESWAELTPGHWATPEVVEGLALLTREIELVKPRIIIALGNLALWALTGHWGIGKWRGSQLAYNQIPVIPTLHPAAILRSWEDRPTVVIDLRRAKRVLETTPQPPAYSFILKPSFQTTLDTLATLQHQVERGPLKISLDIETINRQIACVGLAWSATEAICIPLCDYANPEGYWAVEQEAEILFALYRLTTHPNFQGIAQNGLYDNQYFYRFLMFHFRLVRDTMIAQHTMFSTMPKSLDYLSSMYCQHHVYWKDDLKDYKRFPIDDLQFYRYNCTDCVRTWEIDAAQQIAVDKMGLREPHDFQQSMIWPVLQVMTRGIAINLAKRSQFANDLQHEISEKEAWLHQVCGQPLNIGSPKQMKEFFFGDLRQKPIISRKTGLPTCDDDALERIASREPLLSKIIEVIRELRSLRVFFGTFVQMPLDEDRRIRTAYNIAGTDTYRLASRENAFGSGGNLQNIPKGDDE